MYSSIPKHDDITWHIAKSVHRIERLEIPNDKRVKLYEVNCVDRDVSSKRNKIFENIHDGWFHLLDDDTYFHNNMYRLYKDVEKENYIGMVGGYQLSQDGKIRLYTGVRPQLTRIDAGNVICHHSVLKHVKWGFDEVDETIPKDFVFWRNAYDYFGQMKNVKYPISIYNALS